MKSVTTHKNVRRESGGRDFLGRRSGSTLGCGRCRRVSMPDGNSGKSGIAYGTVTAPSTGFWPAALSSVESGASVPVTNALYFAIAAAYSASKRFA